MSLKEKLMDDLKVAMRDKDVIKKNTVQAVRAAVLQVEKDSRVTLDDDGVLDVVSKELKKRRDVLPEYEKSGREDLIDALKSEIEILLAYLPRQLDDSELEQIIKDVITDVGAVSMKDMGKVMGAVIPKTKGKADNKKVNEIIKQLLS